MSNNIQIEALLVSSLQKPEIRNYFSVSPADQKLYLAPKPQFQEHQLFTTDASFSNMSKIFRKFCIAYHEQLKRRMIFAVLTA